MDATIYDKPWKVGLYQFIQQARAEGKWLFINSLATGPLWFSPDELEAEHREGKFMWGVGNWHMRDPREQLAAADRAVAAAQNERDRIAKRIGGNNGH